MTAETYTVEHLGAVLASGLSEQDAARLILTHGGRRYKITAYRDPRTRERLYVLSVGHPDGGALSRYIPLSLIQSEVRGAPFAYALDRQDGEARIFSQVVWQSGQWLDYPEAFPDGADQ